MNLVDMFLLASLCISMVVGVCAWKFKIRALNLLSVLPILFSHSCAYADASFSSSFGVGSGTNYTGPLLVLPIVVLIASVALSGKKRSAKPND